MRPIMCPPGTLFRGHAASNVEGAALVVFSSAIAAENRERATAVDRGILCVRRAECLVVLADAKSAYVIAGSHGKTTTSSMLTHVLRQADLNPSHYIGAQVPLLGANASWTEGRPFVVEADESDGTLALFAPEASLILNIEEEHLDFYHDIEEIVQVFAALCERTRGPIVYCTDDKNAMLLCSHAGQAVSYGISELADYRALDVRLQNFSSRFTVLRRGQLLGEVALEIPRRAERQQRARRGGARDRAGRGLEPDRQRAGGIPRRVPSVRGEISLRRLHGGG